jgi:hypothetical protein
MYTNIKTLCDTDFYLKANENKLIIINNDTFKNINNTLKDNKVGILVVYSKECDSL